MTARILVPLALLALRPVGAPRPPAPPPGDLGSWAADTVWTPREERDSLKLELEVELGGPSDQGPAGERFPLQVARLSDGRFLIQTSSRRLGRGSPIAVYGSDGKYVGPLAATGDGPGELRNPLLLEVDARDTIWVFERGKVTVFDAALRYVRAEVWSGVQPSSRCVGLTADRWLVMRINFPENDSVPFPLYLTTPKAQLARVGTRDRQISTVAVAPDVAGQVWIASQLWNRPPGYEIAVSDSMLSTPKIVLRRRPSWWTSTDTATRSRPGGPIQSYIGQIVHRAQYRLLIMGVKSAGRVYVEEVDLRRRTVRMAAALEGDLPGYNVFVGKDRVVTYRQVDADGFYTVQVWKVK